MAEIADARVTWKFDIITFELSRSSYGPPREPQMTHQHLWIHSHVHIYIHTHRFKLVNRINSCRSRSEVRQLFEKSLCTGSIRGYYYYQLLMRRVISFIYYDESNVHWRSREKDKMNDTRRSSQLGSEGFRRGGLNENRPQMYIYIYIRVHSCVWQMIFVVAAGKRILRRPVPFVTEQTIKLHVDQVQPVMYNIVRCPAQVWATEKRIPLSSL